MRLINGFKIMPSNPLSGAARRRLIMPKIKKDALRRPDMKYSIQPEYV